MSVWFQSFMCTFHQLASLLIEVRVVFVTNVVRVVFVTKVTAVITAADSAMTFHSRYCTQVLKSSSL